MKKTFKIIGAFVGLILLISVICLALILSKSTDRTAENSTDIKTILVLGSRINQNKKKDFERSPFLVFVGNGC